MAVVDGPRDKAQELADALSFDIARSRDALSAPVPVYNLGDGIERAVKIARDADRPVVVLEHADRANDSTYGLTALLAISDRARVAVPFIRHCGDRRRRVRRALCAVVLRYAPRRP